MATVPTWEEFCPEGETSVLLDANGVPVWTKVRIPSKAKADRRTVRINGIDFSSLFTNTGYTVRYKKILGNNSGYMLDGSYVEDLLARKTVVTMNALPLNEDDLQKLYQILHEEQTVRLYFFDPKTKGYKTIDTLVEETPVKYRGLGGAGVVYWSGITLTFTEV